jgi:aryl-alcohol dehydrogenase-like predicted oxidoreductase
VERRTLGRTGISVPVIGMGTWRTFDTTEDRRPLVKAAIEAGVDLFDSSPMYGRAEAVLAKAIEGSRDRVLIATKVRAVGATHYLDSAFSDMARLMATGRIDMVQIPYNPLRRGAERELLPLAESMGLGVFVLSPLQDGILRRHPSPDELKELGVDTWAQAVLKWIASDRRVSTVLTATTQVAHLRESARAGDPPFFNEEERELVARIAAR